MDLLPGAEPFLAPGRGTLARTGVLVVHGLTSTPQTMGPLSRHLAGLGYAVSAPLLPGHGTSVRDLSRTGYADWLGAVEAAAADLRRDVERMVAVGLSMGGALVTELAADRPDKVDGLVLVNPGFTATDPRLRLLRMLRHVVPTLPSFGDDIRREGGERELAYDRISLKALYSLVREWPRLQDLAGQVQVPVLLARSAHDRVVPEVSSRLFLDRVRSDDVTELVLPESGHVAFLDHDADLLLEHTARFVARVAGDSLEPAGDEAGAGRASGRRMT